MAKSRISVTMPVRERKRIEAWAHEKHVYPSKYIERACEFQHRYDMEDYPEPTLEQKRLSQLIANQNASTKTIMSELKMIMRFMNESRNLMSGPSFYNTDK